MKVAETSIESLGFGCVGLSAELTVRNAIQLLQTAYDQGIRHFDTAPGYGRGYSEKILGKFLHLHRSQVSVCTKFGLRTDDWRLPCEIALPLNRLVKSIFTRRQPVVLDHKPTQLPPRIISREQIEATFAQSCKNLRTNFIEYYFLHEGLPSFLTDEARDFVFNLRQSGRIKYLGIAANGAEYLAVDPEELDGWDILQYEYQFAVSNELVKRFPHHRHFLHSCVKHSKHTKYAALPPSLRTATALADAIKASGGGLVLFSSSNQEHIRANICAVRDCLEKFNADL